MNKLLPLLLSCLVFSIFAKAQLPQDKLELLREKYKLEKISIHTDKSFYLAGDTIWFKAYVMADGNPSIESSKISVRLVNDSNNTVVNLILPIVFSSAAGTMQLPNDMKGGTYSLQAFTDYMAVRDKENFYNRSIEIANIAAPITTKAIDFKPNVVFFPEGGHIIEGIFNTIAFKYSDQFGYPVNGKGEIVDATGTSLQRFEASHNGMGKIRLKAFANEKYFAKITFDNGIQQLFPLPASEAIGVGYESNINAAEILVEVNNAKILNDSWRPAYMLITQNNILIAKNELPNSPLLTVKIPTDKLETGIVKVTLFTASNQPLVERLYFVNNDNYSLEADFKIVNKSLKPKGKQTYQITVDDTLNTNLSISVVDIAYDSTSTSGNNIVSDLFLTEELKGYVHEPTQYFYKNDINSKRNIDLVMMTNGWRRYNWDKILKGYLPNFPEVKQGYLTFEGTVVDKLTNKPIQDATITTIFKKKNIFLGNVNVPIDSIGRFAQKDFIIYDTLGIEILGINNKYQKSIDIRDVKITVSSLPISAGLTISPLVTLKNSSVFKIPEDRLKYYNELGVGKVITLEAANIVASKRWENTSVVNDRYTSGSLFNLGETRAYDFISEPIKGNFTQDLFSYATGRFTGVTTAFVSGQQVFIFRNRFSLTGGPIPMTVILDNIEVPASVLRTIPVSNIALVKIYSANLLVSSSSGGVLAVFTKRGEDFNNNAASVANMTLNIEGYSYVKEFYSPDDLAIEKARINKTADNRSTIYWNPMVQLNEEQKTAILSFYNSDRAKKHRVIIQGFNSAGKLFYKEQIIE